MLEERKAFSITAKEMVERGKEDIPKELISNEHLIYSSPATLAFNSPGAQGFGVKRAGLSIPGSVMLLVAPGCCGRNTTILSELGGYSNRFFYLTMDETDIVTGRHLRKIPKAVAEVYESLETKPTVVMICITCVDALLGTDMERVCKKATDLVGIPVLPCYMYALTREGRKPPMVHVRQSLYSLLRVQKKKSTMVNLLGHFAPLTDDCELYPLLRSLGIRTINEISRCETFEEYMNMGNANFNLVLHPEARYAAADLNKRLGIPSIELARVYQIDKIKKQYELFAGALGATLDDQIYYEEAKETVDAFVAKHPGLRISVGEGCNANAFELSLALLQYGFQVPEIFANLTSVDFVYLRKIAELSPETRIYSNLEPTMIYYDCSEAQADLTIGKDAAYYHPDAAHLEWSSDIQPFGYSGLRHFFEECEKALKGEACSWLEEKWDGAKTKKEEMA
ncbi:MAG: nitrogenase component 1 [Eubacteriales bacterium]|nr:nitrogenase component 1 [Eubacteriales bacterium]